MRGDSGVTGEGTRRVVGVPKFHSWGKCSMPLTNINSDWMSNASSGLCIYILVIYAVASWGVTSSGIAYELTMYGMTLCLCVLVYIS